MFDKEQLTEKELVDLKELSKTAKGDIITMTTLSGSGHPGGSMSSLDVYLVLFAYANLSGEGRDRIVVSHGHTSPGVYASLARLGHMPVDEVIAFFRKAGSPFEGHVVKGIPFIDWSTGNLGQGLSAGCGFAIASKIRKDGSHVYVLMGDGEQQKGQISEARRFAKKYGLSNITVVVDCNGLQISGSIASVMPQNIIENYLSDGWDVIEVNGHDHNEVYRALKEARSAKNPTCIIARTIMGNGVPFMENKEKYHGSPLNEKEYKEAVAVLGVEDGIDRYREVRKGAPTFKGAYEEPAMTIDAGVPFSYANEDKIDNRTAFGKALKDMADRNIGKGQAVCAFDCDLASSVKTGDFAKAYPGYFFQAGIQEHNAATISGALSTTGILTFFADFGVFGIDETYNQHRLNDINRSNLKLMLTHVGLDVGPDGKTHQCVDYIGLAGSLYRFKVIVPCDPNQTDRAVRYAAQQEGNFLVAMGRNRWPVILDGGGKPVYGDGYVFEYGRMDIFGEGQAGAIITYGGMLAKALQIQEGLRKKGVSVVVVNMPCVREIDAAAMEKIMKVPVIVTYEDHNVHTGIAPFLAQHLLKSGYKGRMESFGAKTYGTSGDTEEVLKLEGLDVESMTEAFLKL
ncbi:MAG TPA: transketolase [Syntrophorhabdaceae bacterium]|nr:transketolase [Syntrophorhabdaceae bacterium]HQM82579.1 transketolase [Syntrophorhabdaceae bacterium]